jgi:AcrR family transcriptional regulator
MLISDSIQSPAERRRSKTRIEILAAAHAILKAKGIEELTMRSLAERMDYTPAALYKYFRDKEDILEGLREEGWALLRAKNAEYARRDLTPLDLLRALGQAYQEFASEYPEYYLLMFTSARTAPHHLDEITGSADFKRMTNLVQAAADDGYIQLPPGTTALDIRFLIWFLSHGMAMLGLTLLRECQPDLQVIGEKAITAFVQMIARDARAGESA